MMVKLASICDLVPVFNRLHTFLIFAFLILNNIIVIIVEFPPEMRTMKKFSPANLAIFALSACAFSPSYAEPVTPILDGYAYELYDDIIIDTLNQIININSNMIGCQRPQGTPPLETSLLALHNVNDLNQYIGLDQIVFNTVSGKLFFTSETSNLTCLNGVYVDTIYLGDFE